MEMSEDEYIELINKIGNEEVAEIMYGVLFKVHMSLEGISNEMSDASEWRYGLFKSFYKLYNTTLRLSEGTSYVFAPQYTYTDIKAINTQIRVCHELYLIFQYITTRTIGDGSQDEKDFKYACYRLSGALDNKRTLDKLKDVPSYKELYEREIVYVRKEISECREMISQSPTYQLLTQDIKNSVKSGYWRVSSNSKLSWNDLLAHTPISKEFGTYQYHTLSMYAHTSHAALQSEAQHDGEMNNSLAYMYTLAALMSCSTLAAFGFDFSPLEKREVALIFDLINAGNIIMSAKPSV
ncbi:hypothetical protein ACTJKS_22390 [Pseudomonas sp. 22189]|uniref:hypothetical protein n=1 Tax=Pseudomonas sp. 22189 TaxID=3453889 RepID=UPI003F86854E